MRRFGADPIVLLTNAMVVGGIDTVTIADGDGLGTIVDDDPSPNLTIDDVAQVEGSGGTTSFVFTVTMVNGAGVPVVSGRTVSVGFGTADGATTPAVAGADYTATSGTLTFAAETDMTRTLTVMVTADTVDEGDEIFVVNLNSPVNATFADSQGRGTVLDDDVTIDAGVDASTDASIDAGEPDAGAPDAGAPDSAALDAGAPGANTGLGPSGGCCDAGSTRPPWPAAALLVLVYGLTRRPRTRRCPRRPRAERPACRRAPSRS